MTALSALVLIGPLRADLVRLLVLVTYGTQSVRRRTAILCAAPASAR
jgi:hypothetical protein